MHPKIRWNFSVAAETSEDKKAPGNLIRIDLVYALTLQGVSATLTPLRSLSLGLPHLKPTSLHSKPASGLLLSFPEVPSRLLYTLYLTYILVPLLKNTAQHHSAKCDLTKLFFDIQDHCHADTYSQKLTMSFLHHSLNMGCCRSSFRSRMCSLEIRFNALETPGKLSITVM